LRAALSPRLRLRLKLILPLKRFLKKACLKKKSNKWTTVKKMKIYNKCRNNKKLRKLMINNKMMVKTNFRNKNLCNMKKCLSPWNSMKDNNNMKNMTRSKWTNKCNTNNNTNKKA
jgi:hypothetical protein